jgi:hypothetical protein
VAEFPATIKQIDEDGIFIVKFPDFEEAVAVGRAGEDDPLLIGRKCLLDTLWFRLSEGLPVPAPSQAEHDQIAISLGDFTLNETHTIEEAILGAFWTDTFTLLESYSRRYNNIHDFIQALESSRGQTNVRPTAQELYKAMTFKVVANVVQNYSSATLPVAAKVRAR